MPSHLPPKPKDEAEAIQEIARIAGTLTGIQLSDRHTDMIKSRLQRRYMDLGLQSIGVVATLAYSGVVSAILLVVIDLIMGLRVTPEAERDGLDVSLHGEQVL